MFPGVWYDVRREIGDGLLLTENIGPKGKGGAWSWVPITTTNRQESLASLVSRSSSVLQSEAEVPP